jgi:hypothetical protein
MKSTMDDEAEAFLDQPDESEGSLIAINKKPSQWAAWWPRLRLVIEIAMASSIIFLLFFRTPPDRRLRRSPVPERTLYCLGDRKCSDARVF